MTHRPSIGALIARSGLTRAQAALATGLPEKSAHSAMHDYIQGSRAWPEGLLDQLVLVLRPGLLAAGMTDAEIDAEVEDIRAGFRQEFLDRLQQRRAGSAHIGTGP
jgi:hypothetical protein